MDEKWDQETKEEYVEALYDDYTSEEFDVSGYEADYDRIGKAKASEDVNADKTPFYQSIDSKNEWEFDGMEMEKHSRKSHSGHKKHRKEDESPESDRSVKECTAEETDAKTNVPKAEPSTADDIAAQEEARRIEQEQEAAFERVSKTVQAPIAAMVMGDPVPAPGAESEGVTWLNPETDPVSTEAEEIEAEFEKMFRHILAGEPENEKSSM